MIERFPEVLAEAKRGERPAVAALWRAVNPALLRYLRGRAPEMADDLASETWISVAQALPRFDGTEADFRGWVFTIARNRLIDAHRRAQRRPVTTPADDQLDGYERPTNEDPETAVLGRFDTEAAIALVRQLPPDQADVVMLRVIGDLDTNQVAAMLGKRPGTIRVLQHRGLRNLARLVEESYGAALVTP